jgi:pilus assembly protein FimV
MSIELKFEDEANTKLDLARAYITMGDKDGARDVLKEVMMEGDADQQHRAEELLDSF